MTGVGALHFSEVAVCTHYSSSIGKVERKEIFGKSGSIEQATYKQHTHTVGIGHIFMQHQQIVAEIEIGLPRIFRRERTSAEMVDNSLRHSCQRKSRQSYAPAHVDFFHMGKKAGVEATGLDIYLTANEKTGTRSPVDIVGYAVVLSAVFLTYAKDTAAAIRIAVSVEIAAACSGIFKGVAQLV